MTPSQYDLINWKLLRKQKKFLLKFNDDRAVGLVHLLDAIQDHAVDVLKYSEKEVFGKKFKK